MQFRNILFCLLLYHLKVWGRGVVRGLKVEMERESRGVRGRDQWGCVVPLPNSLKNHYFIKQNPILFDEMFEFLKENLMNHQLLKQ